MFLILICYLVFKILENDALLSNPEILSSYPLKNEYSRLRTSEVDFEKNCPGFKCAQSGLNQVQIEALINKENEIRDIYANQRNVANVYSVHWNEFLAAYAQVRSHLGCILPSTGNAVIYEHVSNKWFPQNYTLREWPLNQSLFDYPTAVEVVLSSRAMSVNENKKLRHSIGEYIEIFNKIDNTSNPLDRRGSAVDIGCSYLVAGNATHDVDYMVCLYGFLYFDPNTARNKYNNEFGTPCSGCTFYSAFNEISETHEQKWSCGSRYPHTCSNLSKRKTSSILVPIEFDCSNKAPTSKLKKPFLWYGLQEISTRRPISTMRLQSNTGSSAKLHIISVSMLLTTAVTFRQI